MSTTPDTDTDHESGTNPDDVVWLGFSDAPSKTICRGPFSNEDAAVNSVSEFEHFHVEPRVVRDNAAESCTVDDVHPTY